MEAEAADGKMEGKWLRRASTTRFCCIISRAKLFDAVAAHIRVGPKTMAKLEMCIRLESRYSVIDNR